MSEYTSHIKLDPKEFKKIGNPHLKKKEENSIAVDNEFSIEKLLKNKTATGGVEKKLKLIQEESNNKAGRRNEGREDTNRLQLEKVERSVGKENFDKNFHAKDLLKRGFLDSYVDYFYLASRKTPDIKSKYEKDHKVFSEEIQTTRELSYQYDMSFLKKIKDVLNQAEEYLREGSVNYAIEEYRKLVHMTQYTEDKLSPIYFIQKCINLAKRYNLVKQLITALIDMGSRFEDSSEDLLLSMSFKEEAKNLFKHLNEKDYQLEASIYDSLIQIYKVLSNQTENQNSFDKAIEYLNKQLENLQNLTKVVPLLKDDKYKQKECIDQQIEVYLKIANLNFKMKYYDSTLECLEILEPLANETGSSDLGNIYLIKGLYLYAQTYEAQEQYDKAINYLNMIEKKTDIALQATEDNIYAKSLLHLGRLYFRQNNFDLSYKNLKSFFKKAKSADNKELLDIGRVNLGMIRGTQGMNDYIQMVKGTEFNNFLKMKMKFFSDSN